MAATWSVKSARGYNKKQFLITITITITIMTDINLNLP